MKIGDMIYTPRFCTVRIGAIYEDAQQAYKEGYYEPTYYDKDPDYKILGKSTGLNHMVFAAVRKDQR